MGEKRVLTGDQTFENAYNEVLKGGGSLKTLINFIQEEADKAKEETAKMKEETAKMKEEMAQLKEELSKAKERADMEEQKRKTLEDQLRQRSMV